MPWPIRLLESRPTQPEIGDAWYSQEYLDMEKNHPCVQEGVVVSRLSPQYHAEFSGKRLPIVIQFPAGRTLCIDSRFMSEAQGGYYGNGWVITGEFPKITMRPSVNLTGDYHGWVCDGVIGSDCDGKKFEGEPA